MRTIAVDTEYDYCDPFLATTTDEELVSRAYHTKVLSQKKELKAICEDRNIRKVFHHASGDMFILRNIGIEVVTPYECTLIAANLVDENYSSRNLKKLVTAHLGIETHESNRLKSTITKYKKIAKKGGYAFKWSQIPEEVMLPYAKKDPEYTLQLWYYWQTPIEDMRKLYEFEKSLIPLIVDMEWKGLRIDRYLCGRKSREYGERLDTLYEQMGRCIVDNHIDLGMEFNPRSPQQIQKLILAMGVEDEGNKNPKTGMPVTDKKSLQKLALNHNFFGLLQQSRFFNKHKGTYYDPLKDYYTSEKNDIAHFMMYQTGAKTGRFSVELAQTFPKPEDSMVAGQKHEVRKVIIPRRGKAFLCIDYDQEEMKLFCHYSNCERMIEIINQKSGTQGFDIYTETAEMLFGKVFENPKYRKALRWVAKQDALGGIYGIGMNKLIAQTVVHLHEKFGREIVEEIGVNERWAYDSLQKFYKLYPIREYTREKISELNKNGFIELECHSRLMDFKRRYNIPQDKAYKGPNAIIQGVSAYIIKYAMKRVSDRILRENWQNKVDMILQVHDELIFEVNDNINFIQHVYSVLKSEMEDHCTFKIPITCSGKWSNKSWGDVKELEI